MEREKVTAVVLAGGSGKRMGSDIPKQYLPIDGRPVLYYSFKAFEDCPLVDEIVLVVGKGETDSCMEHMVKPWNMRKVRRAVEGGRERYHSVREGLKAVEKADYVLIDDGARPLLTDRIIRDSVESARMFGACVAAMPVKDTIKVADAEGFAAETPDRSTLWLMQTPQSFSCSLIRKAYDMLAQAEAAGGPDWERLHITDDAMVAETFLKMKVYLIPGDYSKIKITTPEDLIVAETLLKSRKNGNNLKK